MACMGLVLFADCSGDAVCLLWQCWKVLGVGQGFVGRHRLPLTRRLGELLGRSGGQPGPCFGTARAQVAPRAGLRNIYRSVRFSFERLSSLL